MVSQRLMNLAVGVSGGSGGGKSGHGTPSSQQVYFSHAHDHCLFVIFFLLKEVVQHHEISKRNLLNKPKLTNKNF